MEKEIFICECNSTEHQMVAYLDPNPNYNIVYLHVKLNKYGFWKRIKKGIKYIFGYASRYGEWDEFIINPEDASKFRRLADFLEKK